MLTNAKSGDNSIKPSKSKSRRQVQQFAKNPFLEATAVSSKPGLKKIFNKNGDRMMMVNGTNGEIVAPAGFFHTEEVDKSKFIKLYTNGVAALAELTSAGARVFQIVYLRMQDAVGKDQILLSFPSVDQELSPISESTFYRGVRELIEKDFIAESVIPSVFFINPDYVWNGNRLAFVKEYYLKGSKQIKRDPRQGDLLEDFS